MLIGHLRVFVSSQQTPVNRAQLSLKLSNVIYSNKQLGSTSMIFDTGFQAKLVRYKRLFEADESNGISDVIDPSLKAQLVSWFCHQHHLVSVW
jgi:hypothetical protein